MRSILVLNSLFLAVKCDAYVHAKTTPRCPRWSTSLGSTATASTSSLTSVRSDGEDNITTRDLLSLDYIRSTLIRQEETIIFALIERSQFRQNDVVYRVGGIPG